MHAVPTKSTGEFVARRILAITREAGNKYGDVIVKSDQENAIMAILKKVGQLRAAEGGGKWCSRTVQWGTAKAMD